MKKATTKKKRKFTIKGERVSKRDVREIELLAELQKKHGYMFIPKAKTNLVFDLKKRVVVEHFEYKVIMPKWCAFARAFPLQARKRS